jgi:hypothetical protein
LSRSYRKFLSWPAQEYSPRNWGSFRGKEAKCVHREMRGDEYGDVIFPQYFRTDIYSWCSSHHRYYYSPTAIRDDYYTEINNILNERIRYNSNFENSFLEFFYYIRNSLAEPYIFREVDGRLSRLEWLNCKQVKDCLKHWEGDPLEALFYLARKGLIEKAVRNEIKRMKRK